MKQFAALLTTVLMTAACATPRVSEVGSHIPPGIEAQLERGVSTIADAKALLGPPTSETATSDGTTLGYVHMRTTIQSPNRADSTTVSETLVLIFDTSGRLQTTARNSGTTHLRQP